MKLRPIKKSQRINTPSRKIRRLPNYQSKSTSKFKLNLNLGYYIGLLGGMLIFLWIGLFLSGAVTLRGIPALVLFKFIQDPSAINIFLNQDTQSLHDYLKQSGIDQAIRDYYRPQIPNELELDQYVNQIFYNWTGYVGDEYQVNPDGKLVFTELGLERLQRELKLDKNLEWNGY